VFVVRATRKFLRRLGERTQASDALSTTALGDWYATVLAWKHPAALFVNGTTLLPVLVPLAPAVTVIDRFPAALAMVLDAHNLSSGFVDREVAQMSEHRLATTANRNVIGVMHEFAELGKVYRSAGGVGDLVSLAVRLSQTPCGPLRARHGSPYRELAAFAAHHPE
jgi:hypothetical protein